MAGAQNAFDMQIKLLMIGDSGMSFSALVHFPFFLIIQFLKFLQVSEKPVFC